MTPEESLAAALTQEPTEGEQEQATEGGEQQQESTETKVNPNWTEAWQDVPEPIQQQQKAVFQKWDRDYQLLNEQYRPYKELEDAGYSTEQIQQALSIQNALIEDPRGFYDQIAQNWGFTAQESKELAAKAASEGTDLSEFDDPNQKELAEIKQMLAEERAERLAQQNAQVNSQQEAQNVERVEQEMSAVEKEFGNLEDEDKEEIVRRAIENFNDGKDASLKRAYLEIQARNDRIAQRAVKQAPRVLGGGGTAASSAPAGPAKPMTDDERLAKAMALAKDLAARD